MLHLAEATADSWLERALASVDEVLLDHAHCEKKAASTAMSLIFRYPQHADLLVPLSRLAREELEHFELVLGHLERRGVAFRRQRPSPYAAQLMSIVAKTEPQRLRDTLLCMAMIEARSCERMKLLRDSLDDPELVKLYGGLLRSEARHHETYVRMAEAHGSTRDVRIRLGEIAAHEAAVVAGAPPWPRMHT